MTPCSCMGSSMCVMVDLVVVCLQDVGGRWAHINALMGLPIGSNQAP